MSSASTDLLLREVVLAFAHERKLVMVSPSFLPTVQTAKQFATRLVRIRLGPPDFRLRPELLLEELDEPALVIIDNPNNPTGRMLLDRGSVERVLENEKTLLVVDEAYFEFSGVTFADLVIDHPNLAVTRTLDKGFGLAGARIGYIVAGRRFLDRLLPFYAYLPQSSLRAAVEALASTEASASTAGLEQRIRLITDERERLHKELEALGVSVAASSANFLLVQTGLPDIAARLEHIGILVSDVSSQLAPGSVRVSVGAREENDALVKGMSQILEVKQ